MASPRIKVLIVDDSALVRQLLTAILTSDGRIDVVGTAGDPYVARDKIKELAPDVVTLDIEMPRMDGLTFLRNLMRLRPMPVVMISSLTEHGAEKTLDALALGAFDFVSKPKIDLAHSIEHQAEEIIAKVVAASGSRVREFRATNKRQSAVRCDSGAATTSHDAIVAIGASTGGTCALRELLGELPCDAPSIVVAQHMLAAFSAPFVRRLDGEVAVNVCEAEDGQRLMRGTVVFAPGDRHLEIVRRGGSFVCRLTDGAPVNRHKPSVDVLLESVAKSAGANAIGVMLTGMGADGARGMLAMHEAGAFTIAQDERTSVVWGMPGAAVALGAVDQILPLTQIARAIVERAGSRSGR